MAPGAAASGFRRLIATTENVPLYAMLGLGAAFCSYSLTRFLGTSTEVVCVTTRRNLTDENINHTPRLMEDVKQYDGGVLRALSKIKTKATVLPDLM